MPNSDLVYQRALDRLAAVGFAALTEAERDAAALWHLEADVNNGGFGHYYSRPGGDYARHAADALARLGAANKAEIVRAANAVFGPEGPPRTRALRQAALGQLNPEAQTELCALEIRYYDDPVDVDELIERGAS